MSHPSRFAAHRRIAGATIGVVAAGVIAVIASATANASPSAGAQTDPVVSYFQKHHGVMPTVSEQAHINAYRAAHPDSVLATGGQLSYSGGINGQGVMSGAKTKVYLVFYGNQWGTRSTDSNGDATFTGDPSGVASVAQQMFKGVGTNGETWSADLTQWCDGSTVSKGATSCPSNTPASSFVPYQSGGALAGVWYDNAAAEPNAPNGHALAQEAINAAGHFSNTTSASNRNAYYIILSAHGTNPDNYQGAYCAWHDWNDDTVNLSGGANPSSYGDDIAFSNQPYNTDSGQGCGVGFVNGASNGVTDGYTITLGHEWHEMMSDTYPNTAWNGPGGENSDECAWIQPSQPGGAADVSFGSFGSYAEQASWSNDTEGCAISHKILNHGGGGGDTVTVTNPGNQTGTVGKAVSLQIKASDSASGQTLTYQAAGLPAGLSISSAGLISGTPSTAGTSSVTVTARDTTGATGSTSFTWTVSAAGGGGTVTVTNPGSQVWITGFAFPGIQIKATDSKNLTLTFTATGLPPGMSISHSGIVSGTPTAGGTFTVKVTATDSGGSTGGTTFTFTIY